MLYLAIEKFCKTDKPTHAPTYPHLAGPHVEVGQAHLNIDQWDMHEKRFLIVLRTHFVGQDNTDYRGRSMAQKLVKQSFSFIFYPCNTYFLLQNSSYICKLSTF